MELSSKTLIKSVCYSASNPTAEHYYLIHCKLQAVDIRQIYDKFPEKKGGLKELYDKGPQPVFFLVKFWVSSILCIVDSQFCFNYFEFLVCPFILLGVIVNESCLICNLRRI